MCIFSSFYGVRHELLHPLVDVKFCLRHACQAIIQGATHRNEQRS